MFVTVIAMNEGFSGARRARRNFDNGAPVRLEVLDQEDDPPDVPGPAGVMVPDPQRIGRRSYRALVADPRIKMLSDGESVETGTQAAFEEARRAAEKGSMEVLRLQIENARLQDENKRLRDQLGQAGAATADGSKPGTEPKAPSDDAAKAKADEEEGEGEGSRTHSSAGHAHPPAGGHHGTHGKRR